MALEDTTGDGPAVDYAAHEITGLSCGQLDNPIALDKREASSDQNEGQRPGRQGHAQSGATNALPYGQQRRRQPRGQTLADAAVDAVPTAPPSRSRADATNGSKTGVVTASLRLGVLDSSFVTWASMAGRLMSTRLTSSW